MKPIWKISGRFTGWIGDNGQFFNRNGIRTGTLVNNVLYNHKGAYIGELLDENYIGRHEDHTDWFGPECYREGRIDLEPMEDLIDRLFYGYSDPLLP